ncbi:MAG: hypothetical protein B7733_17045 [Myxococcales bacterium FL481]|nr:MAG: hypothetical protein B7733_17045 [Myxococcales bacterium FL481]
MTDRVIHEAAARHPRWRRLARGLAWTIASAVGLAVLVVLVLAGTTWGTQLLLRNTLAIYDDMVPGQVAVEAIEGRLVSGLRLSGIRMQDAAGSSLLAGGQLEVDVDVAKALFGDAAICRVSLAHTRITLPDTGGGFDDLVPPGDADDDETPPDRDPDLPTLVASVQITDLEVHRATVAGEFEPVLQLAEFGLEARASGRDAHVSVHLEADVPAAEGLEIQRLELAARRRGTRLELESLAITSNRGSIEAGPTRVDVASNQGEVKSLSARIDHEWLAERFSIVLDRDATFDLRGDGAADGATVALTTELPGLAETHLELRGALEPELNFALSVRGELEFDRLGPHVAGPARQVSLDLAGRADPGFAGIVELEGKLACTDCDPGGPPVVLGLEARGHVSNQTGRIHVRLDAAGARSEVWADLDADTHVNVRIEADVPELANLRRLASAYTTVPDVAGRLRLGARCRGALDPRKLDCNLESQLEGGRPVHAFELDAGASLRENELAVSVRKLAAAAMEVEARLQHEAARLAIDLATQRVSVRDLDFGVATRTGQMRLVAGGQVDPSGHNDLEITLHGVELAAARAFVPSLKLNGELDGELRLQGTGADPTLRARIEGQRLAYGETRLGRLAIESEYEDGRFAVRLANRRGPAEAVDIDLAGPFELDLARGVAQLGAGPMHGSIAVVDANLAILAALAPEAPKIGGTLGVDLKLSGPTDAPQLRLDLHATNLAFAERPLGDLRVHTQLDRSEGLRVKLAATGSPARKLAVDATFPVRAAFIDGRPTTSWSARDRHRLELEARGLALAELRRWSTDPAAIPAIEGHIDIDVSLFGSLEQPRLSVRAKANRLTLKEDTLVRGSAGVHYDAGTVTAWTRATGPAIARLEFEATAPVRVDLPSGDTHWDPSAPHRAALDLDGLHLDRLATLGLGLPDLAGHGSLRVGLEGSAADPRVLADLDLDDVGLAHAAAGDLNLHADYQSGRARVDLQLAEANTRLELRAAAPIQIDAVSGDAAWQQHGAHELEVNVTGLDAPYLGRFVAMRPDVAFDLEADVQATGDVDDFSLTAHLAGQLGLSGAPQALSAELSADPSQQALRVSIGAPEKPSLSAGLQAHANVGQAMAGPFDPGTIPLEARFRARDFDLALLDGLLPQSLHDLSGRFAAQVDMDGTLHLPRFTGDASLRNGALTVVPLRQRYDSIDLDLAFSQHGAEISRASLQSGQGTVEVSGQLAVSQSALSGDVRFVATDLPVEQPGIPRLEVDTTVDTRVQRKHDTTRLEVDISKTMVDVLATNVDAPRAIPTMEAVTFVDTPQTEATHEAPAEFAAIEAIPRAQVETAAASEQLNLLVRLADPVRIRGPIVDMEWEGQVEAEANDARVEATGGLSCRGGTFDMLGNEFTIQSGEVTVPPGEDMDLFVELVALTRIEDYDIKAKIHGRASRPKLTLSSDPPFPEAEIFKMLVTGTASPEDADPDQVQAQAAALLAALSSPALQRELNEVLRVDKIGVTFGDSVEEPILSVGKNVSKKVYVETRYHHGAAEVEGENRAEVGVRYRFTPRWFLETYFGTAQAGGVDLFWGRAYDVQRRPWWIEPPPAPAEAPSQ